MKIIQQQIATQLVLTFVACLALLVLLPAQFEIVQLLEKVASQEIEVSFIWWHIILTLPNLLEDFLLLSFALSCALVLGKLWSSGEMLASFSLGISYWQILRVILMVAALIVVLQVFIVIYLVPMTETQYDRLIAKNQIRNVLVALPKQNQLQGFNDGKFAITFKEKKIQRTETDITLELADFITVFQTTSDHGSQSQNHDYHILRSGYVNMDMCLADCERNSSIKLDQVKLHFFSHDSDDKPNSYVMSFNHFHTPFTLDSLVDVLGSKQNEIYNESVKPTSFASLKLSDKLKLFGYSSGLLLIALVTLSVARVNLAASMYSSLSKITTFSILLIIPQYLLAEFQWQHWYDAVGLTILCQCIITAGMFFTREMFWRTYH